MDPACPNYMFCMPLDPVRPHGPRMPQLHVLYALRPSEATWTPHAPTAALWPHILRRLPDQTRQDTQDKHHVSHMSGKCENRCDMGSNILVF